MNAKERLAALAAAAGDRARLSAEALVAECEGRGDFAGTSAADVEPAMQALVKRRWFALAARLGALAVGAFADHRGLRKRYGQSLIEIGSFADARAQFQHLLGLPHVPRTERYEYQGFIGRTFKQQFINGKRASGEADRALLRQAIEAYLAAYADDTAANTWHGINAAALLKLAARRGFAEASLADADAIARAIVGVLRVADAPTVWDEPTWAEACVALNEWESAQEHLVKYLWHPQVSAFTLGSTLRQFEEIWEIVGADDPGAPMVTLLRARLLEAEDGQLRMTADHIKTALRDQSGQYEKVFGNAHFTTLKNYRHGLERCAPVARIGLDTDKGDGTGFLMRGADIDPRLDGLVLVTNAHVIDRDGTEGGIRPADAVVTFQALDGVDAEDVFKVSEVLFSSPRCELDIAITRLEAPPAVARPYPVAAQLPLNGARVTAIGHPSGGTLSLSLEDNELLDSEALPGCKIHYRTPTEGGSSGSPIFTRQWELIAVHHYGGSAVPKLNGKAGTYETNEGTTLQAIRAGVAAALV